MRRFLVIALIAVLALAAAWSVFWFYTAQDVVRRLAAWTEAQRGQGLTADYAGVAVRGFPLAWRVTIEAPAMAGAGPTQWEWRGETMTAEIRPWSLHDVPVTFPGRHHVSGGAGSVAESLTLQAARPDGRVVLTGDGKLALLSLDLGDVRIRRRGEDSVVHAQRVRFDLTPHRVAQPNHRTDVLDLTLSAEQISQDQPPKYLLGNTIDTLQLDISVKGTLPTGPLDQSVQRWRDDGGVIEANRLALRWGPLDFDGNGTLALDAENRPLGAFTARIRGYGETVDALAVGGLMRPREATALKIALNLLARRTASGGSELNVPVTAQDGRLTVAGFMVTKLPPLRFE